jgi:S1/P1 Nuclease
MMRVVYLWVALGCVVLLGALLARDVYAWGDTGHHIICEIAFQELNPQAREAVQRLMQQDPDFSLLSKACTWPDHPRKRASEHFVNLPRAATRLGDQPCPVDAPCVVTAIEADLAALTRAGATDAEKLTALKFLGHWVGDVHQPLHVSFKDDKGGNDIHEEGPCADNLHAVWDTCIIQRKLGTNIRRIAAELRAPVTADQRTQWTSTSATDWANESFAITTAEDVEYCVQTATGCLYEEGNETHDADEDKKVVTVDDAYMARHLPTIKQRLTQAGVRLGALLNRALGGA